MTQQLLHVLALYMAVTLITGCALLLVWRQEREQQFCAWLGLAHLLWVLNPGFYLVAIQPEPHWQVVGRIGLVLHGGTYWILQIMGIGALSGRRPPIRKVMGVAALGMLLLAVLISHSLAWAQAGFAAVNVVIGAVLASWLMRMGPGERFTGVLILLTTATQYIYVIWGDEGAATQATFAAILRVMLGLSLMYAAMTRSKARVQAIRDRFYGLSERSLQGVVVMQNGRVTYANPAFRRIFAIAPDEAIPDLFSGAWVERTVPEPQREAARAFHQSLLSGERTVLDWEGERRSFDGRRLDLHYRAWMVEWEGERTWEVVVTDETGHRDAMRALEWRAAHDELTGLPNRAALKQRLQALYAASPPTPFALILLDIDRFKLFNDAHGHEVGDEVLIELARLLQASLPEQAEVVRLGEDEFAILAVTAQPEVMARTLGELIKALLSRPLVLRAHSFFLDVSMGVALPSPERCGPQHVLQAATAAMYEAKRLPGTSMQWASEQASQALTNSFGIEQALRSGLQNEEFKLVYQPKVAADDHQLLGFEALVRWDRPGVGRVSPLDFIAAAERNGLIVPLGAVILDQACRQMAAWRDAGLQVVPVAVNVSPLQLLDASFPQTVMRTLQAHGVPPQWLTLEITETAAVTHMAQANEHIRQLREQGVEVALDDFGTGFSSLNMLRSLPLHTVKIDRSLIDPMPAPDAVAVVRAICDLAATLDLHVVAEGVETTEHADAAREAGCHALQGYFFARPLEPADATQWLARAR